jgi:hypothetical protein
MERTNIMENAEPIDGSIIVAPVPDANIVVMNAGPVAAVLKPADAIKSGLMLMRAGLSVGAQSISTENLEGLAKLGDFVNSMLAVMA